MVHVRRRSVPDEPDAPELLNGPRAALSPDDQYLLLIGLVAQADALLEYRLRVLWVFETDTPGEAGPWMFNRLHAECVRMVKAKTLPPQWMAAALSTLTAARKAHQARDRVVHDAITREPPHERMPDPTAPEWTTLQYRQGVLVPRPNKVTLADLQAVAYDLRRTDTRVHFLALGLSHLRWDDRHRPLRRGIRSIRTRRHDSWPTARTASAS
jgi:hypothetical protein